jgi:hypothetical protein
LASGGKQRHRSSRFKRKSPELEEPETIFSIQAEQLFRGAELNKAPRGAAAKEKKRKSTKTHNSKRELLIWNLSRMKK